VFPLAAVVQAEAGTEGVVTGIAGAAEVEVVGERRKATSGALRRRPAHRSWHPRVRPIQAHQASRGPSPEPIDRLRSAGPRGALPGLHPATLGCRSWHHRCRGERTVRAEGAVVAGWRLAAWQRPMPVVAARHPAPGLVIRVAWPLAAQRASHRFRRRFPSTNLMPATEPTAALVSEG